MSEWVIKQKAYKPEINMEEMRNVIDAITLPPSIKIGLVNQILDSIDLNTEYYQKHIDGYIKQWYFLPSGQEHYRLLDYLVTTFSSQSIVDIGTHKAASAVSLAGNETNKVYTFDIAELVEVDLSDVPNITKCIDDVTKSDYIALLQKSCMVFLDTSPHEGVFETQVYNHLNAIGFKGLLCLDDIHLNEGMNRFWDGITHRKVDVTKYGHHTGTGLVAFSDTIEIDTK